MTPPPITRNPGSFPQTSPAKAHPFNSPKTKNSQPSKPPPSPPRSHWPSATSPSPLPTTSPSFANATASLGPPEQYADEKPNGPIELRIYPGANGSFTLYADEGDYYNYETGHHATIPITWSQSDNTLTIGARQGTYPGMPTNITFNIVWVKPNHGVGPAEQSPDKTITYNGSQQTINP